MRRKVIAQIIKNAFYSSIAPSFRISPNPANSIIQVRLTGYSRAVTLQLTDLAGKMRREKKLSTDILKYTQQQFSIGDVASGTYLIVAVDKYGHKQSQKVVIIL